MPLSWLHVANWSGLRGAISLALALSLPAALGSDRDLLRIMVFGVVLFTLLIGHNHALARTPLEDHHSQPQPH